MNKNIIYKSASEIEVMRRGGEILRDILTEVSEMVLEGISEREIDKIAAEKISNAGVKPAFLGYNGFPATIITCVNDGVVHGIPSDRILKDGDLLTLDLGIVYKDFYLDKAITFPVGGRYLEKEHENLIKKTEEAFSRGVEAAQVGNLLNDISVAIESVAKEEGFSVVRETTGHGLGKGLHEDPVVFNFSNSMSNIPLKEGLVIAIEPIFTLGGRDIVEADDGWLLSTKDGSYAAHYENTVAITKNGPQILTL